MRFCKPVPACGLQFWSFQVTSDSSWCFVFVVQQYVIFLLSVERLFLNRLDPRHYGIHEQSMNHSSVKKSRPRCYVKSPTAQDVFLAIPVLISCAVHEILLWL